MPDILLHLSCLKRDGFDAPLEGTRITCEAVERQKGYQCLRVLSVDHVDGHSSGRAARAARMSTVTPSSGWVRAKVKWFNRARGFGFVTRGRRQARHLRAHGDAAQDGDRRTACPTSGSMCASAKGPRATWRPKCACRSKADRRTPTEPCFRCNHCREAGLCALSSWRSFLCLIAAVAALAETPAFRRRAVDHRRRHRGQTEFIAEIADTPRRCASTA